MTIKRHIGAKLPFCWKSSPLVTVILILCIACFITPFLIVASHTMLNADDYGALVKHQTGNGGLGVLRDAARVTGEIYMQHMGSYSTLFLGHIFMFAIVEGWISLPVLMVILMLLLFVAWIGFVMTATCSIGVCRGREERNIALLFAVAALFCVYDTGAWPEVDNWISGYNAYGLPTIFGLVAASLMCRRAQTAKIWTALAVLCAFLGVGGTLQITAGVGYILFAIFLIKVLQGIAKPSDGMILAAAILGGLINVAAPGNYVRRNGIDPTGFHPGIALPFIIDWGNQVWTTLLTHPWVLAMLIGIFVLGIHLQERIRPQTWKLLLLLVACLLAPYASALPVCVGYGGGYFPNRCLWAATSLATLALMTAVLVLGCLVGRGLKNGANQALALSAKVAIVALACWGTLQMPVKSTAYTTLLHLADGTVAEYCQEVENIVQEISQQEGKDVKVPYLPEPIEEIKVFSISPDPETESNRYLAAYFNLNSVSYEPLS
ncbi:MAG: hypothetical protein DBX91_12565 [Subdoligranulum variabile]|nr:MAG: hypothetical protein DBX91_12565 [Subdoligranulum variabile]